MVSIVPKFASHSEQAREELWRSGAVLYRGEDRSPQATAQIAREILSPLLLAMGDPIVITSDPGPDRNVASENISYAHTDGYAYGFQTPDIAILHCIIQAKQGGQSFLIDGYRLIEDLHQEPESKALLEFIKTQAIDQSDIDKRSDVSPILRYTEAGRLSVRYHRFQRHVADHQKPLIEAWRARVSTESLRAERFTLNPGDMLLMDNYRVLHGREGYQGHDRRLHRIWAWTSFGFGLPEGVLGSDSSNSVPRAPA